MEKLEIGGRIKTIQTSAFLRLARLLRYDQITESWKLEETGCLSDASEKPSVNAGAKN